MIEVSDLCVAYPGSESMAVQKVSFSVKQGQFFSLVGPSGCGKTTTLRSIAGLEEPASGEIYISETAVYSARQNINVPVYKRGIGMVFQSYAIWPHMKVSENVAFPLTLKKEFSKSEIRSKVEHVLEVVGLKDFYSREATMLSGGQQQRLALARAIVGEPKVLLLDEPLSNLDAKLREQMRVEIRELQQRLGITTLYVTHDQEEALSMSDTIAVMDHGQIVQMGAPEEIYHRPANDFVAHFIGNINLLCGQWTDDAIVFPWGKVSNDSWRLEPHGWYHIAIRPEDIEIVDIPHQENMFTGRVTALMFMGQYYDCRVQLSGDCAIRMNIKQNHQVHVGDTVKLRLKKEAIRLVGQTSSQPSAS